MLATDAAAPAVLWQLLAHLQCLHPLTTSFICRDKSSVCDDIRLAATGLHLRKHLCSLDPLSSLPHSATAWYKGHACSAVLCGILRVHVWAGVVVAASSLTKPDLLQQMRFAVCDEAVLQGYRGDGVCRAPPLCLAPT